MKKKNKIFDLSGLTLIEIVTAILITSLVIGGLIASYLVVQRSWGGGSKQIVLQSQGRVALNHICRNIRESELISIADEGKTLALVKLDGLEKDPPDQMKYTYDAETHQIIFFPSWPDADRQMVLLENVWPQPESQIFSGSLTTCYIRIRIIDINAKDGYQGIDLSSFAYKRN